MRGEKLRRGKSFILWQRVFTRGWRIPLTHSSQLPSSRTYEPVLRRGRHATTAGPLTAHGHRLEIPHADQARYAAMQTRHALVPRIAQRETYPAN
mmetsp:Transcript_25651/g.65184  ORF Transcript_25651/g.65184 Transcript_25651/m.65184 type:complete len:95 (-) Transcript_25651:207-491(-)